MNSIEKQLKEATKHIVLSVDEKALMREQLVEYTKYKPIKKASATKKEHVQRVPRFAFFRMHHFSGALVIAILVTTSSFGVSRAATTALPGDLLYPVKVNVNEGVKTAFQNTDEKRINWDRERAELRLAEASQLAAEGKLDAELQKEVVRRFNEHTEAMVTKVLAVEEENPVLAVEVSTEFEAALETHEVVLARLLVENDEDVDEEERELVEQVHTAAREAGKIREDVEEKLIADEFEGEGQDQQQSEGVVVTEDSATDEGEGSVPEEKVELTDSANMRVHAVYRAETRAAEHLAQAESFLAELDPSSDIAVQAEAQIASGKVLVELGDAAVQEYDLGTAYSAYRRAAGIFQKVALLLEVADLFAIEIYSNEVEDLPAPVDSTVEGGTDEEIPVSEADAVAARDVADAAIRNAQTLLLTYTGYEATLVERVNGLIKDASASILRGEITLVLGDIDKAYALFVAGEKQAGRATTLLEIAAKSSGVQQLEGEGSEKAAADVSDPEDTGAVEEEFDVTVNHQYNEGLHTYTGNVHVASSCIEVVAEMLVAESYPEQLTLQLNTSVPEGVTCEEEYKEEQVIKEFRIEVSVSAEAVLMGVYLEGVEQTWKLEEVEAGTEENTQEEQSEGEPTTLMQRAIESTQELLLPD